MSTAGPPAVANWLISRLVSHENRESMIGDLIEQHQRGRSSAWYWRQTAAVIASSVAADLWQHKLVAASVVLFTASLNSLYMLSRVWMLVWRVERLWYPHVINSRMSWLVINPWAYRLQPYWWTANVAWCLLLAAITWLFTRVHPKQRGLVIALMLIPQLASRAPYLWISLTDWLREPRNPLRFYGLLWFAFYTVVAVPLSIFLGGRRVLSS
jgi:hypothetical protein